MLQAAFDSNAVVYCRTGASTAGSRRRGDAAKDMSAGAALSLLSLPDTPHPDGDAPSAMLRGRHAPAAAAVPAPAATSSQTSEPGDSPEARDVARAEVTQQPMTYSSSSSCSISSGPASGAPWLLRPCSRSASVSRWPGGWGQAESRPGCRDEGSAAARRE